MKTRYQLQTEVHKVAPEDTVNNRSVTHCDWAGVNQAGHIKKTSISRDARTVVRVFEPMIPRESDQPTLTKDLTEALLKRLNRSS